MTDLLIRMAIWIRRPPSRQWLYAAMAIAVLAVTISGLEWLDLWPDWARQPPRQHRFDIGRP